MPDLSYPRFPARVFAAAGAALAVLAGAAVIVNESGPDVRGCAVAAARVMGRENYSAAMMELMGREAVPACRGLSEPEFVKAIRETYQIQYGHVVRRGSERLGVPPPAYRALSARSQLRQP